MAFVVPSVLVSGFVGPLLLVLVASWAFQECFLGWGVYIISEDILFKRARRGR